MKNRSSLTTGEFAKLCGTTKETLFHYDKLTLLKPKNVLENGYRYYEVEQFFEFDLISILKETGTPLKEIKELIHTMDADCLLSLLNEKIFFIKKEKDRLAQREDMLQDMMRITSESMSLAFDSLQMQAHAEERLEIVPTVISPLEPTAEFAKRFAEYIAYYENERRIPSYPYGVMLDQNGLVSGEYLERFFFSRATRFTPDSQLHVKPEGTYAVLAHKGAVQTHLEAFEEMLDAIRRSGMTITGDAYVCDMMSVFLSGNTSAHSSKYCIRVE